jgi:hypothetical protein
MYVPLALRLTVFAERDAANAQIGKMRVAKVMTVNV